MSRRIIRSTEPNRNSETALASSVLPVPVGPANRNTPIGLSGSFSPALSMAMRSTMASTASSWPITRAVKKSRIDFRSSCPLVSRMDTGRPENCDSVSSTRSRGDRHRLSLGAHRGELEQEQRRARQSAGAEILARGIERDLGAVGIELDIRPVYRVRAITSRSSNKVAAGGSGSSVTVSNRPRSDGLSCTSRAVPLASPRTTRPAGRRRSPA